MPLPLPGGKKASESRYLSSGHQHDRTAFESFAPDISERPDQNITDLFDTRNHGSQRLSARYEHTRDVLATRTHTHTTRDTGVETLTVPWRGALSYGWRDKCTTAAADGQLGLESSVT